MRQTKDHWNQWVANERDRAPGDYIADWFRKAADSALNTTKDLAGVVSKRIDQLNSGKRLLDEGGPRAQEAIYAKTVATKAITADRDLVQRLNMLVRINREEGSFTSDVDKQQACLEAVRMYGSLVDKLGDFLPDTPTWGSDVERDAGALMQIRMMKSNFGNTLSAAAEAMVGAASRLGTSGQPAVGSGAVPASRGLPDTEDLMLELFKLHDLNGNGVLEEQELVQLNKKIAMLHHGKDTDKKAVETKYKGVFREKLDNQGRPVPYEVFRTYMVGVLNELDKDRRGQVMILEQFIAEAESAREVFAFMSFASVSDEPFLAQLGIERDEPLFPSAAVAAAEMAAKDEPTLRTIVPHVRIAPPTPAQIAGERRRAEEAAAAEAARARQDEQRLQQQPQQQPLPVWGSGQNLALTSGQPPVRAPAQGYDPAQPSVAMRAQQSNAAVESAALQPPRTVTWGSGASQLSAGQTPAADPWQQQQQQQQQHQRVGWGYAAVDAPQRATLLPPPPPAAARMAYAKGSRVQVWSNSKNAWLDAIVSEAFDRDCFSEGYAVPAGSYKVSSKSGHKWIMPENVSSQLRPPQ